MQVPESLHWRCREPGEEGHRAAGARGGGRGWGPGQCGPLTCWVAVAGLAWRLWLPAVEVLLAALTVWPGCVVTAAEATPTMARAAEELPVKHALLRVAAAVASCGQEAGEGV